MSVGIFTWGSGEHSSWWPCGVIGRQLPFDFPPQGPARVPRLRRPHGGNKNKNTKIETVWGEPEKASECGQPRSSSDRQFLVELSHPFRHRQLRESTQSTGSRRPFETLYDCDVLRVVAIALLARPFIMAHLLKPQALLRFKKPPAVRRQFTALQRPFTSGGPSLQPLLSPFFARLTCICPLLATQKNSSRASVVRHHAWPSCTPRATWLCIHFPSRLDQSPTGKP